MPTLLFRDIGLVDGIGFDSWRRVGAASQQTRKRSPNRSWQPAPPTAQEHETWLAQRPADSNRSRIIATVDEMPAGNVRLDRLPGQTPRHEVGIAVDAAWHRRGVGNAALALVDRITSGAELRAHVRVENTASRRLFMRAGFVAADSEFCARAAA